MGILIQIPRYFAYPIVVAYKKDRRVVDFTALIPMLALDRPERVSPAADEQFGPSRQPGLM
ncbi:MAG: hypothetical protein CMF74_04775 [Maricaulis sp.]|nr:hypothetical protein [Maricaulis sp.]